MSKKYFSPGPPKPKIKSRVSFLVLHLLQ